MIPITDSGSQSSPVRDDGHVKPRTDGISHEVNNAAFSRRPGDHKVEMEWPAYATAEECKSSDAENNEVRLKPARPDQGSI